jgi:predicted enzyme related to lactoylglutathione lyase
MPNGKICYVEIPAADIKRSADFYVTVFGWSVRVRGDGSTAFDDTTGAVSGAWVLGRTPAKAPAAIVYVMVDSIPKTIAAILAAGGSIDQPETSHGKAGESHATFRDPAGNLFGIYQEPRRQA